MEYDHISDVKQRFLGPLNAPFTALCHIFRSKKYHDLVFTLENHRCECYDAIFAFDYLGIADSVDCSSASSIVGHHFL